MCQQHSKWKHLKQSGRKSLEWIALGKWSGVLSQSFWFAAHFCTSAQVASWAFRLSPGLTSCPSALGYTPAPDSSASTGQALLCILSPACSLFVFQSLYLTHLDDLTCSFPNWKCDGKNSAMAKKSLSICFYPVHLPFGKEKSGKPVMCYILKEIP